MFHFSKLIGKAYLIGYDQSFYAILKVKTLHYALGHYF